MENLEDKIGCAKIKISNMVHKWGIQMSYNEKNMLYHAMLDALLWGNGIKEVRKDVIVSPTLPEKKTRIVHVNIL